MPFVLPSENITDYGSGVGVCLIINEGFGGCIQSLPVVWQMVQDGIPVTVVTPTAMKELWECSGATVRVEKPDIAWVAQEKKNYEKIIRLSSWSSWECDKLGGHVRDTVEQFAELVGGRVPESFSFTEVLGITPYPGNYTLFASESNEPWRTLPDSVAHELYAQIEGEKVWLTSGPKPMPYEMFVLAGNRTLVKRAMEAYNEAEEHRVRGRVKYSWRELLEAVAGAGDIITVENGVASLAAALGKRFTVICGMTSPEHILTQFRRWNPSLEFQTVRGESHECKLPCYRSPERGFIDRKCCGYSSSPLCLENLDIAKVLTLEEV